MGVFHDGISLSIMFGFKSLFPNIRVRVVKLMKLFLVEVALGSLIDKLGGYDLVFNASLHSLAAHFKSENI